MSSIQVYCAVSLDGFIAGPDDDLGWLGEADPAQQGGSRTVSFAEFLARTGAMLMGRRTFDVVMGFGGEWPYGSTPVLVATTRPLPDAPKTVTAARGEIVELCEQARQLAGTGCVYVDGGNLMTQALDAGCIDEMILSVVPVLLGDGVPLYQGNRLHRFDAEYLGQLGETLQTRLTKRPQDSVD